MKLSRRDFLLSTVSALAVYAVSPVEARFPRGSAGAAFVNSNTVMNLGAGFFTLLNGAFLNLAKWNNPTCVDTNWIGKLNGTNNYPNGTFSNNLTNLIPWDPVYYQHYILAWGGQGLVGGISGIPTIVYSGASATGVTVFGVTPADKGVTNGNMGVETASSSNTVSVEFSFGVLLNGVSTSTSGDTGGAGLVKFSVDTSSIANWQTGITTTQLFNGVTGLPATGPNPDGSWTINQIDSSHFSLQLSSAYAGLVGIVSSGGPGVQTEALNPGNALVSLAGTFAGFSNLVLCKKADLAAINSGLYAGQGIIDALLETKAAYMRFMDMISVQNIQGISSFSDRVTPNSFTWQISCPPGYYGGQLTNTADAFTLANPSSSPASGAYVDGEVAVGQVPAAGQNTTQNPTLQLTGRSGATAAPIYTGTCALLNLTFGGSVPASGTIVSIVFNGGGLSSPFTYHYTTSTTVAGPGGVTDTTLQFLEFNIRADIQGNVRGNAGPLVTAGISSVNGTIAGANMQFTYNRNINSSGNAQLGAGMTISASDNGSGTTYTVGQVNPGYLANSNFVTFTYSALLQGWIATPYGTNGSASSMGGVRGGPPLEFYEEVCKRCNSGMYYNVGLLDQPSVIYNTVLHIANSGVKLALAISNESWNNAASQWNVCETMAYSLGINSGSPSDSFTGLRILQMAQQAVQAWSDAGRSRADLKIINEFWFIDCNSSGTTSTVINRFNGTQLNASSGGTNKTLKAFGGAGATAITTNYSVAPNRPIDWSDDVSGAAYWGGGQYNSGNGFEFLNTGVPLSAYNGSLLAAYNYAYGNSTQQAAALDFLYSISTQTGDLYNGTLNGGGLNQDVAIASWAIGSGNSGDSYFGIGTVLGGYDTSRSSTGTGGGAQAKCGFIGYEGGWFMGPISNTGEPATVASSLTTMGYTNGYSSSLPGAASGGPTGSSDTAALAGNNLAGLLTAWKNDARCLSLVSRQFAQFKAAVNIVSTRDAYPAWYGFQGPQDWGAWPLLVSQSGATQAVAAMAAYH